MQTQIDESRHWMIGFGVSRPQSISNEKPKVFAKPMTVSSEVRRYARPDEDHRNKILTAIAVLAYQNQHDREKIYQCLIDQKVLAYKGSEPMSIETIYRYIKIVRKMLGWKPDTLQDRIIDLHKKGSTNLEIIAALNTKSKCVRLAIFRYRKRLERVA